MLILTAVFVVAAVLLSDPQGIQRWISAGVLLKWSDYWWDILIAVVVIIVIIIIIVAFRRPRPK